MKNIKKCSLAAGILWILLITFPIAMIIDLINGILQIVKYAELKDSEKEQYGFLLPCGILILLGFGIVVDWVTFTKIKNRMK